MRQRWMRLSACSNKRAIGLKAFMRVLVTGTERNNEKNKRDKRIIQALQDIGMQEIEIYPMFVPTSGDFASNYLNG